MGVFQNNLMGAAAAAASAGGADFYDHQIANSCRYQDSANSHMYLSMGTATNVDKYTFSTWFKHCDWTNGEGFVFSIGSGLLENLRYVYSSGAAQFYGYVGDSGSYSFRTNGAFRDPSAWYHIVFTYDSTQSTAADRVKLYINGVSQSFSDTGYTSMSQNNNSNSDQGSLYVNRQATWSSGTSNEAYFAETIFVDGTGYAASDFGEEKNGVWIPKDPSELSFGNNGFYLKYESSSDLGNDSSSNNNDLTVGAISPHDQMLDSPTFNSDSNGGNFATWNPLNKGSYTTLAEGNLKATGTGSGASNPSGTFAMTSGKWYWEMLVVDEVSSYPYTGLTVLGNIKYDTSSGGDIWAMRYDPGSPAVQANSTAANILGLGTITVVSTGVQSVTDGDIISYYLDCDNRKAWIAKNGTIPNSGNPANGTNPQWSWTATPSKPLTFTAQIYNGDDTILNAGQDGTFAGEKTAQGNSDDTGYGNFYYDPPTGFLAMCSGNLPLADAINPSETDDNYPQKVVTALAYSGDGNTTRSFTLGFQPNLSWVKQRSHTYQHILYDTNRTYATLKAISPDGNWAEGGGGDNSGNGYLSSSDSSGFSVNRGTNTSAGTSLTNTSSTTYASWHWKEGADYGLDIVTYTGSLTGSGVANISHSLGAIPECIWHMHRGQTGGGCIRHQGLTSANYIISNNNTMSGSSGDGWGKSAQGDKSGNGNMTALGTSSTFTTNYTGVLNVNGDTYVAYVWRGIEGLSKFGSYEGNGSGTDGPFIYTGFRPALVIIKNADSNASFFLQDNARDLYNPTYHVLKPNVGNAEEAHTDGTDYNDFLSNGFKVARGGDAANFNTNDKTYIYMAWAHNPFKYATAR
jgi:hypothetical protein